LSPLLQTYTLSGLTDLIGAGVRMVQPNIVKMGGISGMLRRAAVAEAHGVELVPHQTQPTIGHTVSLHLVARLLHITKPCEWNDSSARQHAVFENLPKPADGLFHPPTGPGLGLQINEGQTGQAPRPDRVTIMPRQIKEGKGAIKMEPAVVPHLCRQRSVPTASRAGL
jgi:L-alanine-DL-glutamate epimerase-like enolase superfamily enzyme